MTITGLDNGTTYEVRVRAVNSVGVGDWSPIGRGTPVAAASAPTALTVTAGDGQLVVNWQAPADDGAAIESYEVEHRREGGSWERQTSTATTVTITGLDNGTTYEVRVRAVNSVGVGDWSPIGRGTPVAAASAPTALTVTAGDGQLVVSWQAPADDGAAIESYEVEHRREGGSWERQTSTATTVTITGLDNGTTYEVRVRAVNSVGAGGLVADRKGHPGGGGLGADGADGDGWRRTVGGELAGTGGRRCCDRVLRSGASARGRQLGATDEHGDNGDDHGPG